MVRTTPPIRRNTELIGIKMRSESERHGLPYRWGAMYGNPFHKAPIAGGYVPEVGDDEIMPAATEEVPDTGNIYETHRIIERYEGMIRKLRALRSRHRKQITQMNRVHTEDMRLIVNLRTQVEILDDIVEKQANALRGVNAILYPPTEGGCGDDEGSGGCV